VTLTNIWIIKILPSFLKNIPDDCPANLLLAADLWTFSGTFFEAECADLLVPLEMNEPLNQDSKGIIRDNSKKKG